MSNVKIISMKKYINNILDTILALIHWAGYNFHLSSWGCVRREAESPQGRKRWGRCRKKATSGSSFAALRLPTLPAAYLQPYADPERSEGTRPKEKNK